MFDTEKLKTCTFKPRTATITVKPLAILFEEGEKPEFTVRGLTGEELAQCAQAARGYSQVEQIITGMLSNLVADKVEAIKSSLGLNKNLPEIYAKRIEFLIAGCVAPEGLDREAVIRIAAIAPIEFQDLTDKIMQLSGEGAEILGE